MLLLSHFSRVRLCATPWTAAYQAPLPMGFSRQEYWSGCHCLLRIIYIHVYTWTSLVAQMAKCLPTMQETWVQSLGQEDPLEKEMAIHSSSLAWKIPWMEEPGKLQSVGSQRIGHN